MTKPMITKKLKLRQKISSFGMGVLIGLVILSISLAWWSKDHALPNMTILGMSVGGKSWVEIEQLLRDKLQHYQLNVVIDEEMFKLPKNLIELDITTELKKLQHNQWQIWLKNKNQVTKQDISITLNVDVWQDVIDALETKVKIVGKPAEIQIKLGQVIIKNGDDGQKINQQELKKQIYQHYQSLDQKPITLPIIRQKYRLNENELDTVKQLAKNLKLKLLELKVEDETIKIPSNKLVSFLKLKPGKIGEIDDKKIEVYLQELNKEYNCLPKNAKFAIQNGLVQEFAPAQVGIEIIEKQSKQELIKGLKRLINSDLNKVVVKLRTKLTQPEVTIDQINNLGIKEVIGQGESDYAHSIPNRVYNVNLASQRLDMALIKPDEEFSFIKQVGEISGATGYRSAYVISKGKTELGDGGGVCQVSTTLFRAILNAGLPITERWAHTYRVGYYEQNSQPGIDATIYAPSKDLKFINNTNHYLLIQTINQSEKRHLTIKIYGTKDNRKVSISKVRVWGVTPPPPDLYQDDPSLPSGVVKQIDWSAWGAKTAFDYQVVKNGEILFKKTFFSNYKPWQNVFLKGTGE